MCGFSGIFTDSGRTFVNSSGKLYSNIFLSLLCHQKVKEQVTWTPTQLVTLAASIFTKSRGILGREMHLNSNMRKIHVHMHRQKLFRTKWRIYITKIRKRKNNFSSRGYCKYTCSNHLKDTFLLYLVYKLQEKKNSCFLHIDIILLKQLFLCLKMISNSFSTTIFQNMFRIFAIQKWDIISLRVSQFLVIALH